MLSNIKDIFKNVKQKQEEIIKEKERIEQEEINKEKARLVDLTEKELLIELIQKVQKIEKEQSDLSLKLDLLSAQFNNLLLK